MTSKKQPAAKSSAQTSPKSPLEAALAELQAIPAADVSEPSMPIATYLQEARDLLGAATLHLETLTKVGLDAKWLHVLPLRIDALAEAQSRLQTSRHGTVAPERLPIVTEAEQLRSDLVSGGRYALRSNADAQAVLDRIQEGDGLPDLVQDLIDLGAFVHANRARYQHIGVDTKAVVARAAELAKDLGDTLTEERTGSSEQEALALRNRALSHVDEAVNELRSAGRYAFRNDTGRTLSQFRSAYSIARGRRRRGGKAPVIVSEASAGAAKKPSVP